MKPQAKIKTLKSIKIGFDIAIILLSLFFLFFITLVYFDLSTTYTKSSLNTILAKVVPNQPSSTNDFVVSSSKENIHVYSYIESYNVIIDMKSDDVKNVPIIYKIIFLLGLNLNLFFLIFVLYQGRNILKSIINGIKGKTDIIKHYIFNRKNIRRFQYIAYGFIAMPLIELIIYLSDSYFFGRYFNIEGFSLKPAIEFSSISWDYVFVGLLFISLIEIIRRGITIQEENDLTV
jgi:hypothetical protein